MAQLTDPAERTRTIAWAAMAGEIPPPVAQTLYRYDGGKLLAHGVG